VRRSHHTQNSAEASFNPFPPWLRAAQKSLQDTRLILRQKVCHIIRNNYKGLNLRFNNGWISQSSNFSTGPAKSSPVNRNHRKPVNRTVFFLVGFLVSGAGQSKKAGAVKAQEKMRDRVTGQPKKAREVKDGRR
jgi:hypothetical protein